MSRVSLTLLEFSNRVLRALQQNRSQARLLYLLNQTGMKHRKYMCGEYDMFHICLSLMEKVVKDELPQPMVRNESCSLLNCIK